MIIKVCEDARATKAAQTSFKNVFTEEENMGKQLFTARPDFDLNGVRIGGGAGCDGCHRAPEFDIDPDSIKKCPINPRCDQLSGSLVNRQRLMEKSMKAKDNI